MQNQVIDFSLDENAFNILFLTGLTLLSFFVFWYPANSPWWRERVFGRLSFDEASSIHNFSIKVYGFIIMAPIAYLVIFLVKPDIISSAPSIFAFHDAGSVLKWTLLGSAFIIPLSILNGKIKANRQVYPQVRAKIWNLKILIRYLAGWGFYLLGYEILFRGILFLLLMPYTGFWPALAINVSLYSATHMPKGRNETLGAIPMGIIFCFITAEVGNIWPAFIIHVLASWSNSLSALIGHPEMQLKLSER
jgi:membrane protease YdiL (CAAX protease family)